MGIQNKMRTIKWGWKKNKKERNAALVLQTRIKGSELMIRAEDTHTCTHTHKLSTKIGSARS